MGKQIDVKEFEPTGLVRLDAIPNGIYIINVTTEDGTRWSKKLVRD